MRSPTRATCVEPGVQSRADLKSTEGNVEFRISPGYPFAGGSRRHILSTWQTVNLSKIAWSPHATSLRGASDILASAVDLSRRGNGFSNTFRALGLHTRAADQKPCLPVRRPETTKARLCSPSAQRSIPMTLKDRLPFQACHSRFRVEGTS